MVGSFSSDRHVRSLGGMYLLNISRLNDSAERLGLSAFFQYSQFWLDTLPENERMAVEKGPF